MQNMIPLQTGDRVVIARIVGEGETASCEAIKAVVIEPDADGMVAVTYEKNGSFALVDRPSVFLLYRYNDPADKSKGAVPFFADKQNTPV